VRTGASVLTISDLNAAEHIATPSAPPVIRS
jgi:hypothetical protein